MNTEHTAAPTRKEIEALLRKHGISKDTSFVTGLSFSLMALLEQQKKALLTHIQSLLPKEKELAPNGHSERVGYNQCLTEINTILEKERNNL